MEIKLRQRAPREEMRSLMMLRKKKGEWKKNGCLVTGKVRILFRPATAGLLRIRDMTQISSSEKCRPPVTCSQFLLVS